MAERDSRRTVEGKSDAVTVSSGIDSASEEDCNRNSGTGVSEEA